MRIRCCLLALAFAFLAPATVGALDFVPVRMTLDALSVVSLGDQEFISIPAGSLALRVYPSGAPDSLAIRVDPSEFPKTAVSIRGMTVNAELAEAAKGSLQRRGDGIVVNLELVLRLTYDGTEGRVKRDLPIRLTTETVEALASDGSKRLSVHGTRANESTRVLQLVGETSMGASRGSEPSDPVYVVLSGTLDKIPEF